MGPCNKPLANRESIRKIYVVTENQPKFLQKLGKDKENSQALQ